jgi:zinc transport system substrate-binding protein
VQKPHKRARSFSVILVAFLAGAFLLVMSALSCAAGQVVVASTSLAGAVAHAANAQEVRILTPADVQHPPEYDVKPTDLLKLEGADIVVYAGYERMVSRLVDTSRNKRIIAIQINTEASPENLISQVQKVAVALKTEKEAQAWEKSFRENLAILKVKLNPVRDKRVVAHWHARPFAAWAGLSVVQVVRPGELTPRVIADAISQKPDAVLDILHAPVAKPIADNAKCRYIQVINFPGVANTVTLEDIFAYNTNQLLKTFR